MYQSPVSTESLILESMDIGAPALAHSFSFTELQQQAIDGGVHVKNAMQATSKEELRELIGRTPPNASPVSRLSSAYLLPSTRRRRSRDKVSTEARDKVSAETRDKVSAEPRDKVSAEPRDNLLWRQNPVEPQPKTNSTYKAATRQQEKQFLVARRENAEKMLSGQRKTQSDSAGCEPQSRDNLETVTSWKCVKAQQTEDFALEAAFEAHLEAMELRHTEYVFGKIVLRMLAAAVKTWQARCLSPVSI